jgi:hypothetical protein
VTVHNPGQTRVRPGDSVALTVEGAIHLFDTGTGRTLRM